MLVGGRQGVSWSLIGLGVEFYRHMKFKKVCMELDEFVPARLPHITGFYNAEQPEIKTAESTTFQVALHVDAVGQSLDLEPPTYLERTLGCKRCVGNCRFKLWFQRPTLIPSYATAKTK